MRLTKIAHRLVFTPSSSRKPIELFSRRTGMLAIFVTIWGSIAFPPNAFGCQELSKNEVVSKFLGKWDWTLTLSEGMPEMTGACEISVVDGSSLEINSSMEGLPPLRQIISIPRDDSFSIKMFQGDENGAFDEESSLKFTRQSKLPATKLEATSAEPEQKKSVQANKPTPEELEKYLGDWEIVSELSVDGIVSPISSEGGEPPGGDSKCYMRVHGDYLTDFDWNSIRQTSEESFRESADEVEWTHIDENGLHGELYMTIEGVREHVRSCILKVTGKRALLRIDQSPRQVKVPFKLISRNDIYYPTIYSLIRTDNLIAKEKK